jgi:hypothetical protein
MRLRMLLCVLALLLAASGVAAQSKKGKGKKAPAKPSMEEMMKRWQEVGSPGASHKILDQAVGEWDTTMRMSFNGVGLSGYDNFKRKYVFSWADNMGTMLVTAEGSIGRDGKTITYLSRMDDPMTGERNKLIRYVSRILGPDKHVLEAWDSVGTPRELKVMEITYTRKGSASDR